MEELRINGWILVDQETDLACDISKERIDFRGDKYLIVGGRPPHKPSSSGFVQKVYIMEDGSHSETFEYYASTADCKWMHQDDEDGRV